MPTIDRTEARTEALTAIRRDLPLHPRIGFEEVRTSAIVTGKRDSTGNNIAPFSAPPLPRGGQRGGAHV